MLERVPTNPQITYEYTQTILITNNIKPNTEEDIIVRRLNHVRWMFQQIHAGFAVTKIVDDAKNLYDRWNVYISANIEDDNYFQYRNLPSSIPDTIAGARRKREEDSDDDSGR
ncbi:35919_t:CDS:2, partial [Racocetra persica]